MHYITPSAYRGKWYKHKQSYCVVNYRLQDVHIIELYPISYSTVRFLPEIYPIGYFTGDLCQNYTLSGTVQASFVRIIPYRVLYRQLLLELYPIGYYVGFFCQNYTLSGVIQAAFVDIIPDGVYYAAMNTISEFVKRERKKAGLTQEEFALRSGLGLRFVRELEQGKETVRLDKVNQALGMFGMEAVPGIKRREGS